MKIAVVTDSTGSLDPADAAREGIVVVPLQVIIGADVHFDGTVPSEQIAQALADFVPVNTSRPSPEEFLAAYERL
ncbi:MAG: fatty acid-binding protein DegV, partial [Actinomycetales bacterium]